MPEIFGHRIGGDEIPPDSRFRFRASMSSV
jgi:hypothetical protein